MVDIFISYAREDIDKARTIARELEARGYSVFWDRDIPHGQDFNAYLPTQTDAARCMIVLWSIASLTSQFVRDEAVEGLNGRLVPARIEDVRPPLGFRQLQSADLTAWRAGTRHEEFDRFVGSIENVLRSRRKGAIKPVDPLRTDNAHLEWREDSKGGLNVAVCNDTSEALRDVWIKVLDIRMRSQAGDFVEVQNFHGAGRFEEFSFGAGFGSDSYPDQHQPLCLIVVPDGLPVFLELQQQRNARAVGGLERGISGERGRKVTQCLLTVSPGLRVRRNGRPFARTTLAHGVTSFVFGGRVRHPPATAGAQGIEAAACGRRGLFRGPASHLRRLQLSFPPTLSGGRQPLAGARRDNF